MTPSRASNSRAPAPPRDSHRAAGEILSGSEAVSLARSPAPSRPTGAAPSTAPSSSRRPNGFGRALSRRQVKQQISAGQWWEDFNGSGWQVRSIWRADGLVLLQGSEGARIDGDVRGVGARLPAGRQPRGDVGVDEFHEMTQLSFDVGGTRPNVASLKISGGLALGREMKKGETVGIRIIGPDGELLAESDG
jgi:hypothetical protein